MNLNTFFQLCIYFCICMIVLTLSINFINGLDIFETVETGVGISGDSDNIFSQLTGLTGGMEFIWLAVTSLAGVGAVLLATFMHSAIPVGAYLFSVVFWTSYGRSLSVLSGLYIPSDFLLIGTVAMLFIWAGALAGMFSGSG